MKLLGLVLLIFAASTAALDGLGHESALLALMDSWGVDAGRFIRFTIGVCGIGLLCPRKNPPIENRGPSRSMRRWSENESDPMSALHNKWAA